MPASNPASSAASDREIVIRRAFQAPRELVYRAWTDPHHIGHWWGPTGFTTTTHEMDVRPGGVWRFIMHGPDGTDFLNKIVYVEVAPPERLAYEQAGEGATAHIHFRTTVTFTEQDGKTEVTLRMVFDTAKERAYVVETFGAIEGGEQTLARLEEYVAEMA